MFGKSINLPRANQGKLAVFLKCVLSQHLIDYAGGGIDGLITIKIIFKGN